MLRNCEVLIIGMGPSGMVLAKELQKHGIDYVIVDKRRAVSDITRAVNITPASLAILEYSLQLSLAELTLKTDSINAFWQGKAISRISYRHQSFPYRHFCYLPQPTLEQLLYQQLTDGEDRFLEQTEVLSLEKKSEHYIVHIRAAGGEDATIQCDYVMGCDGNNSLVREWLGIPSDYETYQSGFVLYDIETVAPLVNDSRYYLFKGGYVIIVPIALLRYRVIVSLPEMLTSDCSYYNNTNSVQKFLKHYCGLTIDIANIIWFTSSEFRHRLALAAGKEKSFLLGDALHTFSPVGGLNLNTGLQDAINLGWKLAYVIKGRATSKLLESYGTERMAAIEKIKDKTKHLTKVMTQAENYPSATHYISSITNRAYTNKILPQMLSGYDSYENIKNHPTANNSNVGHHISTIIRDEAVYTSLCRDVDTTKFNLLVSEGPIQKYCYEDDFFTTTCASGLQLDNGYLLLRPDGYVQAAGDRSQFMTCPYDIKKYLGVK